MKRTASARLRGQQKSARPPEVQLLSSRLIWMVPMMCTEDGVGEFAATAGRLLLLLLLLLMMRAMLACAGCAEGGLRGDLRRCGRGTSRRGHGHLLSPAVVAQLR